MKKIKPGFWLIYLSLIITTVLWVKSKNDLGVIMNDPMVALNQITALLGTTLFVWSMILSTRLEFLENLFDGLDKTYKVHRRVSEWGAGLILLHPISLAISDARGLKYFLPTQPEQGVNLGVIAFWIFAITILLTLFIRKLKLAYHVWKWSHKFLNLAMILVLIHTVMVTSDVARYSPLGTWMNVVVSLGVASGLYMSFLYRHLGPKYKYKITKIKRYGGVHDLYLKPVKKKLPYKLAQYAYVAFEKSKIGGEAHPYCVTSLSTDDVLRVSIKELGDYTKTLGKLRVGETANIWGAYGKLGEKFTGGSEDAIFIAGGIGVAPFLSMFRQAGMESGKRRVAMFYCTKYRAEASFGEELEKIKKGSKNLYYHNQCSREKDGGHLTTEQVMERVKEVDNTIMYLCGPSKMMSEIRGELIGSGFGENQIVLEDFEMI